MFDLIRNLLLSPSIWLSGILAWLVYYLIFENWNFFKKQNVPFIRGWPILGSIAEAIIGRVTFTDAFDELYWTFPNEKVIGFYSFLRPVYYIRDREMVKQIVIKDSDNFVNHFNNFDHSMDAMLGKGLFFIKDQRWRDFRSMLSPAFTGSKMRTMFTLISDCTNGFVDHLKSESQSVYEMKDLFTRFANDIIATCAFGLEINSLKEPDNEFFRMGTNFTNLDGLKGIKFLLYDSFPRLMKFFKVEIFEKEIIDYFRNVINKTVDYRLANKIVRPDLIHLIMEAKEANKILNWDNDDLIGQCLLFYFAGFETTSTLMSFMSYELAVNPNVQQRLYEEILETEANLKGEPITYDAINKMKYLDAVISETLRRWTPLNWMDRAVNKPYKLEYDGKTVQLNVGDTIIYPMHSYHLCNEYFPNAVQFDPERFNDENRDTIIPGTYQPFGMGQRLCIGQRFALMECKSVYYRLLLNFSFEKCIRTQYPLKLKKSTINLVSENGILIELRPR